MILSIKQLIPGTLLSLVVATSSYFIAEHYGMPTMLLAILIGLSLHSVIEDNPIALKGVQLFGNTLLKLGIILMGLRLDFSEISSFGFKPVIVTYILVGTTVITGILLAKLMGQRGTVGILSGSSVAICGASAAIAVSSLLSKSRVDDRLLAATIVTVTLTGTVVMLAYPPLLQSLGLDHNQIGMILGATIHDVAQVVAAGFSVSPEAAEVATYIKVIRISALPLLLVVLLIVMKREKSTEFSFPFFILGFALLAMINSLNILPIALVDQLKSLGSISLVVAMGAIGLKTSFRAIKQVGGALIILIVLESLVLGGAAFALLI